MSQNKEKVEKNKLFIKYFLYRRRHFPAFASAGRFPGGPASANFFLSKLGRNGSSARPISPWSRLLQLQQENKKKVSLLKNVLIPPFLPFRRGFFLRNVRRGRRWE
jgi:hypothetical protein